MLLSSGDDIYFYSRWNVKQLKKKRHTRVVLHGDRMILTQRRRKKRNAFNVINVVNGKHIDQFEIELNYWYYSCMVMNDDVLVIASALDGVLKMNLRWFATKKMAQYVKPLTEPFTSLRSICLKDDNLVLHLTNWQDNHLIEVRPLDNPHRVALRMPSDCLSKLFRYVGSLTDLLDDQMRICEPVLRHDFGFDDRSEWIVKSIHSNAKYLLVVYVSPYVSFFETLRLQMRRHAMDDASTQLVYVYDKDTGYNHISELNTFFGDDQMVVVYNDRIVSLDFRSLLTQ